MKRFDISSVWPGIYLKPTRTDLVLDAVVGLILLVISGMELGAFFFPACFPGSVDWEHFSRYTSLALLLGAICFWGTRYPLRIRRRVFDWNPPDNSERRHRIDVRGVRILAIFLSLLILWNSIKTVFALVNVKWLDDILRFGGKAIVVATIIWIIIRVKIMK